MKKKIFLLIGLIFIIIFSVGCKITKPVEQIDIQILATSDLHGKFYPWLYSLDCENKSGSMVQLATAINERKNQNTLLLDAGDIIQDNSAELFLEDDIHPMVASMNAIGYDAWTTGNHEYNYGMDVLRRIIGQQNALLLLNNVRDRNGELLGEPYHIFERGGVRIGVVGMVTPNITKWDAINLAGFTVSNPIEECRKAIEELKGKADILIAVLHGGIENEYGVAGSGARDIAEKCPEFDLIIASHEHRRIPREECNGVLIVENQNQAQTMAEIHLKVEKSSNGCRIIEKTSDLVEIKKYNPDEELMRNLAPYHEVALEKSHMVIGRLEGGNLKPENEIMGIPQALVEDTDLIDFVNSVMMHYSGAKVSAAPLTDLSAYLNEGDIRVCDIPLIFKFTNTLYSLRMTGRQLKKYMEWSAAYYQQYHEGDLTIAFNPDRPYYNYDMFHGVNYKIDISKPIRHRICELTWPDGTPVKEDETFVVVTTNYRVNAHLLSSDEIFDEGDIPEILDIDICGNIGGIRELIRDYIENVKNGVIVPEVDYNWEIIGNNWNEELHRKAVRQLNEGKIALTSSENGKMINMKVIREDDLK